MPALRRVRDPAIGAYLAVLLLAVIQASTGRPGVATLAGAVPYAVALATLVVVGAVRPPHVRTIQGVAAAGAVLAAWLLVRFTVAIPAGFGEPHGFYRVKLAVTSPVGDHNTAAGLLLVGLVAASVAAADDRRWSATLVVAAGGIVATLSRGAAIVLVGVAVASWVLAARRRIALLLSAAATAVIVGLVVATVVLDTSPPPGDAAGPLTEAGAGALGVSVLGRVDLAVRGVEVGLEHPALGVGLGGFVEHAADLPRPNDHAHQALAHAFAEGGALLLLVTAGLPVLLALRAWRLAPSPVRDLTLLGGAALVVHAQIEILAGRIGYEVLLALLLGLSRPRKR